MTVISARMLLGQRPCAQRVGGWLRHSAHARWLNPRPCVTRVRAQRPDGATRSDSSASAELHLYLLTVPQDLEHGALEVSAKARERPCSAEAGSGGTVLSSVRVVAAAVYADAEHGGEGGRSSVFHRGELMHAWPGEDASGTPTKPRTQTLTWGAAGARRHGGKGCSQERWFAACWQNTCLLA